ncbi:N-acetylmuramoyl-L-alanine amidase [Bosea sp. BK604]|uniref:N-acetylmuramoyl-L-alanine amidase n=1 Tax=Bosea sp. BK604 TaxID=2512180 RepID=UPI00104D9FDF|nr:N-acetylmuramoyl-L-alanine amidase [Bosea sp. BK604]TCR60563.1 N-acetylmuramoyl-L-alanine amidase [Bosea sp. BK604]
MVDIVIDPGHGGSRNVGGSDANHASGPSGLLEKTATLDVAKRVAKALEAAGHNAVLTRTTDENLGLAARAKVAERLKAPVFVSVHFNGFDGVTQGTETFCHTTHFPKSAVLCKAVQAATVTATGLRDRNRGGVKTLDLGVLNPNSHDAATACVLLEVSFMDVPDEDRRLQTAAYKDKVAAGIAAGIGAYVATLSVGRESVPARQLQDGFEALLPSRPEVAAGQEAPRRRRTAAPKKKVAGKTERVERA